MDKVLDYVFVTNVIPQNICKQVLKEITAKEWVPHSWHSYTSNNYASEIEKELEVQNPTQILHDTLAPFIFQSLQQYMLKFVPQESEKIKGFIRTFTPIRFNRYRVGTMMREHYDHIHSIFDGNRKGIPILSIVGFLNDDFEGGEFLFSRKDEIPVKAGDILLFPSNFMYPHEVKEVTQGERYSFVSWAF
ncbi:2OG-Fe(II) oxygenase [Candidatus Nitronereus thalassa]|uniref:2OG-Fe(II) oxygenase n=1 Tax=Candidatus Nitronereus thalassa TaxID=3020898 RepID=A0ABU3K8F9_9BACT|nr:2OG-Fe(II) oxygenase [Candidatus Nitronereus thalassa]MDT7042666.1 2OG-Fe(II) oxygenase [Candidatus Nitronereus thalassa]